ncbi:DUF2500 domain-containing protein [Paenibacillus radicis (ex Xue et al. 2023)]|uniref:DUF2500 domain-containing protein n=1 Tax=Paenibacillus radicis (ex Xue et al. 2023) TaxID=2972489 RepID=A0ABT1YUR4_9BACL|nr:DUF2500 domain-containing protein [Paenibacillus radicis (ex Xue et al. 2023)]MCR8636584.1 DUF2500 domain-containing protein [Paenibacillus radicis (ex Xue et al. 2023)]
MFNTGPSMGGGFEVMFTIVPILIVIGFVIVIVGIITNGARYFKNAKAPRQSVFARVVAKRMEVRNHTSHHSNSNGGMHPVNSSRTYYYITLEFDNGERKEYLDVKSLFGLVVEGDEGYAAVQGDWIVAFERERV